MEAQLRLKWIGGFIFGLFASALLQILYHAIDWLVEANRLIEAAF